MINDAILKLVRGGEGATTEFKTTLASPEMLARTICGFLNTNGGVILCGVDDEGRVVGVDDAEQKLSKLERQLQAAVTPNAPFQMSVERDDDLAVIVIEVPVGRDGPYVVDGRMYLRKGPITRAASAEELRSMVLERSIEPTRWERRPSSELMFDDLDTEEIQNTINDALKSGRHQFKTPDDQESVLRELGCLGGSGLTNGCDVVFGARPARRIPQVRAHFISFATDKGGAEYNDDRWFEGPVIKVLDELYAALVRNLQVQARFREGDLRRSNRSEYPFWAIREGLVNALAHRDYSSFSGGMSASLYPDRLEIWNSGRLPGGLKPIDLRKVHPSIPVNPDIANVFRIRDLMDRAGRGTRRIVDACRAHGLPNPKWEDRATGVTLTLFNAPGGMTGDWNHRQQSLLENMRTGERLSPGLYHERYAAGVSERQARRDLVELEEAGLLVREGGGATTVYRRTDIRN